MITYLAVPYSHPDPAVMEARYQAANHAATHLIARGEIVFSPISHNHKIAEKWDMDRGWDFWMKFDTAFLSVCSRMVVLAIEGHMESKGVAEEMSLFRLLHRPVTHLSPQEVGLQFCFPYVKETSVGR